MVHEMQHADQALMKNVIEECHVAAQLSSACATHCIEMDDAQMTDCIRFDLDAADAAEFTARLAARGSPFVRQIAQATAEVLEKSSKMCKAKADGSSVMSRCYEATKQAAESCRQIGTIR